MATETATKTGLQVGDRVIFVEGHGERPVETVVIKTTRTNKIRIVPSICDKLFDPPDFAGGNYTTKLDSSRYSYHWVCPWSEEAWAKFNATADEKDAAKLEKIKERKRQEQERDERIAAELAEVKKAFADSVGVFPSPETLPDGTRLYRMTLPVKEEMKERKGGFEIAFVHCKDMEDYTWTSDKDEAVKVVSYASTCIRGVRKGEGWQAPERSTVDSFPSISGNKAANDEEALWETARYLYHGW